MEQRVDLILLRLGFGVVFLIRIGIGVLCLIKIGKGVRALYFQIRIVML